jgi:hypothetical protein
MSDEELQERARRNFGAYLTSTGPHPDSFVEACTEHPPWAVYEFGTPPRRGLVVGVSRTPAGYTATLAVLHKHNRNPPLTFERKMAGISLGSLTPVGVDPEELARWAG